MQETSGDYTTEKNLQVKDVTMFKHGVASFTLRGEVNGTQVITLEFKKNEMNDILKSLLVMDTGEGHINSIAYDADQDIGKLLEDISVSVDSQDSFASLVENFKGASVVVEVGGNDVMAGKVMGIQVYGKTVNENTVNRPSLVILSETGSIVQVFFSDIKSLKLLDAKLQKDLDFYLETIISGKKKDSKRIFVHCDGKGEREVMASYIIESPVWKTSYRMIMPEGDKPDVFLSGWALVENTTEQDWEDIELSLVAGMPVSFVCPIYPPIYMERPVVEPPKVAQIGPAAIEDEMEEVQYERKERDSFAKKSKRMDAGAGGIAMRVMAASTMMAPMAQPAPAPGAPPPVEAFAQQAKQQTTVSTKDMGEVFAYKIAKPVTIKRKQSALVPIVASDITSKSVLLFEETQHPKHPMACLEITNTSGMTLEQGPLTIFQGSSLAGEAMLPFLVPADSRILTYALEQGVIVDKSNKNWSEGTHKVSFGGGYCYSYYFQVFQTTYKIRNKTERVFKLYVDHAKIGGYDVFDTKLEPKDTPNFYRFDVGLGSKKGIEFDVKMRHETYSSESIRDLQKNVLVERVQNFIKHKWINPAQEGVLTGIADLLEQAATTRKHQGKLETELNAIFNDQTRLRSNIQTMGTSRSEENMREKYVSKLDEQETRIEQINQELDAIKQKARDLSEKLEKKLKELEEE